MGDAASLYSSAPMQVVLAREMSALAPILSGAYGNFGLMLRPRHGGATVPPHLLGNLVEIDVDENGCLAGDVRCLPWQLPFASESFKVLIVQHALERIEHIDACVAEFARVLAPEGIVLMLGFNPFGTWRPWLLRRERGLRLRSARVCEAQLAREQIETLQIRFPGLLWPRAEAAVKPHRSILARFGSSWLLIARKRRSTLTPVRMRAAARGAARAPQLAPGARRNRA
ncbi:MAG: methyltransferase domain-containing protein [Xanthomonadaceae bacterium]|nr:methyltransferase domain-containing protein [Xanthomonadaceae bacterium]MDE2083875.1 methyltransferase domain-containing protein [Xanthomonadaceae bacterium]MDE2258578.1 methyltransferase domain-containing protein [Xanthomonadaceae bacterium]